MEKIEFPTLKGETLFRKNEFVYLNKADEMPQYCSVIHKHDFIEIVYVISGKGIHVVGDSQYETKKGDLFVINYDMPHGFFSLNDNEPAPVVYDCVFKPEFVDAALLNSNYFEALGSSFLFKSLLPESVQSYPDLKLQGTDLIRIGELFDKMYQEYKVAEKGYVEMIRAYLILLIIEIFRAVELESRRKPLNRNRELIDGAIEYLKKNYSSDIRLEDLAMKSFLSKNYLSRLFKELSGINISDYIQRLRIEKACSLLRDTDLKIIDIAHQVGFNDIAFFYDVFKKITQDTPGQYRTGV